MENVYLSLVNQDTVISVLGITFLIMLFIGITDLVQNMKKMGE